MMKKSVLAAALAVGITGTTGAHAITGIQIDPTGAGSIGGSTFITSLGSSFGNFFVEDAFSGAGLNNTVDGQATIWGQNSIQGILGGEITLVFSMAVTPSLSSGNTLILTQFSQGTFDLYYDTTPENQETQQITGAGYTDFGGDAGAHHIARGVFDLFQNEMAFGNTCAGGGNNTCVTMSSNEPIPSIKGQGSGSLQIDFTQGGGSFVDTNYIVNDLVSAAIDLFTDNQLSLAFNTGAGNRSSNFFNDGAVAAYNGGDGKNDFQCALFETCGLQTQMNTTFTFQSGPVPEPGTLALLGAGTVLFGGLRRRQKKA